MRVHHEKALQTKYCRNEFQVWNERFAIENSTLRLESCKTKLTDMSFKLIHVEKYV